jgi:arylsulfatase A-like enzyme
MDRRQFLYTAAGALGGPLMLPRAQGAPGGRPNIVLIYADDIGYGDTGPYGATRVRTPNLDRMAAQGLRFSNAYCSSATCTPSRYSLLTGEYAFRKPGSGVLPGNAPMLIEPGRTTVASVLKKAGYATGVVGKWHLGLGAGNVDWNAEVKPGPEAIGFDYSFLIPATGDRTPCVYVENGRVVGLDPNDPITVQYGKPIPGEPTGVNNPGLLRWFPSHGHDQTVVNGISRIGYMKGGEAARWVDEGMADTITRKATDFIAKQQENPFFLYFSTHDIHVPRVPHPRFQGKSECGIRCDATVQFDWSVGRIMDALERHDLTRNTLLIVMSDNGPVVDDGYEDGAFEDLNGHLPAGPLRGGKYSIYEGGTRTPFLVRWPGRVKPGVSDALVGQVDLMSSLAALTEVGLAGQEGVDSVNVLPALLGESSAGREHLVQHAGILAIRAGKWKYIPKADRASGSLHWNGGNRPANAPEELYDLEVDLGERNNVVQKYPQVAKRMAALLEKVVKEGRSRN